MEQHVKYAVDYYLLLADDNSEQYQISHFQLKKAWEDEGRCEPITIKIPEPRGHDEMTRGEKMLCEQRGTYERAGDCKKAEGWGKILTPELVVVAAALRLPAAVSGLADVALVVDALAVQ